MAQAKPDRFPFESDFGSIPNKVAPCDVGMQTFPIRTNTIRFSFIDKPEFPRKVIKYHIELNAIKLIRRRDENQQLQEDQVEKTISMHRGMKGEIPAQQRKFISYAVIDRMIADNKMAPVTQKDICYDSGHILYSPVEFVPRGQKKTFRIEVADSQELQRLDTSFMATPSAYEAEVEYVEEVIISKTINPQATLQFLDVLTSMFICRKMLKQQNIKNLENTFYFMDKATPFSQDPRILVRGISKAVKLVNSEKEKDRIGFAIQLQVRTSPFLPKTSVVEFLAKLLERAAGGGRGFNGGGGRYNDNRGGRDGGRNGGYDRNRGRDGGYDRNRGRDGGYDRGRNDRYGDQRNDRDRSETRASNSGGNEFSRKLADLIRGKVDLAKKHMKNVVVRTTHQNKNRFFPIHTLTDRPFGELSFEKNGQKVRCFDHFQSQRYAVTVNPDLPCAVQLDSRNKREIYYPLEVLEIVEGQKVSIQKTQEEPNLTEMMTRECQLPPSSFVDMITTISKETFVLRNMNIYTKLYGIDFETDLSTTQAFQLRPPEIVYSNSTAQVDMNNLNWRLERMTFAETPKGKMRWGIVAVNGAAHESEMQDFARDYLQRGGDLSLRLDPQPVCLQFRGRQGIADAFVELRNRDCGFAIFVSQNKTDEVHTQIKVHEIQSGVISQHVVKRTISPMKADTFKNFIMKSNLKLGGLNHYPRLDQQTARTVERYLPLKATMFMGLGFSGAGPLSLYERQLGKVNEVPNAAALVYSLNDKLKMRGSYWYTRKESANEVKPEGEEDASRDEERLRRRYIEALSHYKEANGRFPDHIIVYRTGSSVGDYVKIVDHEIEQLKTALRAVDAQRTTFTFIVAADKSGFKYFKTADQLRPTDKPAQQNVRGGTMLCREFTSPRFTEFILQSHRPIQGTGRTVRYTVLADTRQPHRLPAEVLASITNMVAYAHAIVTSPVSTPAILYSACSLAERAQKLLKYADDTRDLDALAERMNPGFETRCFGYLIVRCSHYLLLQIYFINITLITKNT
ncbi:unnamed protein product [Bursaphelenchus xylophilus]|nr:unnamed protein product [Bursaphelenchus xylophilus]CAG9104062.1 unnamed protein product [Bursaphelenchus xylophilus]